MMRFDFSEIAKRSGRTEQEVVRIIMEAKKSIIPIKKTVSVVENSHIQRLSITKMGAGILDTDYGKFWEYNFQIDDRWLEYKVLWYGEVDEALQPKVGSIEHLLMRIDSGCETGQVMGDKTCECREQLHIAMEELSKKGQGLIVHIPRQDGRGMGTSFKLATLYLQDQLSLNTVESAEVMSNGGEIDVRTYGGVIGILKFFGITNQIDIELATNNPLKVMVFGENGYKVNGMKPIVAPVTERLKRHLVAKQAFLGHLNLI